MKKKVVLFVAIILVAVTACALLVGCAPANPDKFMEKFIESDSKAYYMGKDMCYALDGDIMMETSDEDSASYYELSGDEVICYSGYKDGDKFEWRVSKMNKEEFAGEVGLDKFESMKKCFNVYTRLESAKPEDNDKVEATVDYKKDFEKKDGWLVGKEGTPSAGMAYKISSKEMLVKMDFESEAEFDVKAVIGHKLTIPAEAKAANK